MADLKIHRWPGDKPLDPGSVAEVWARDGFSCDLWVDPPGQQWLDFVHQTDERVVVKEGEIEFEVEDARAMLGPGDEVFIPAGSRLSITVLVVILLILIFIGVFGVVVHFGDHREVVLPKPSGAYSVGRALFDWKDPDRLDPYSSAIGNHRELMVWMWYPATSTARSKTAEYVPSAWAAKLPWRPVTIPGRIRVHALAGAPVAASQKPYPVLIFSSGIGNLPSDYTSLIEDIASHGYVVLGITNTYSAPVVRFPDGRVANRLAAASFPRGTEEAIQLAGNRMVKVWAADIHFAVDRLAQMNSNPRSRFYGHFDLGRVGMFGHSFGGAASAEACSMDSRC
ncbi:MAG: hypothetical protein P8Z30_14965 [Acidobacteriota bacterium]